MQKENSEAVLGKGILQQIEDGTLNQSPIPSNGLEDMLNMDVVDPETVSVESEMTDSEALMNLPTNIPYEKIYNDEGVLVNPVLKGNPYLSPFMNRRDKKALIRKATRQPKNNKKGIRLVVTKFAKSFIKTKIVKQVIPEGLGSVLEDLNGELNVITKIQKARTLTHNKTQL